MATDPTTIPSIADLQKTKKYMDDINDFVSSENDTLTDADGKTRRTLTGVNDAFDSMQSGELTAQAIDAADRAETAADAAALSGNVFTNTSDGISSGLLYFSVVSPNAENYLDLYKNVSNTAVYQKSYPSSELLASVYGYVDEEILRNSELDLMTGDLIQPSDFVEGYLRYDGTVSALSGLYYTESYIRISESAIITLTSDNYGVGDTGLCFYDRDQKFISGVRTTTLSEEISIPAGSKFIRVSVQGSNGVDNFNIKSESKLFKFIDNNLLSVGDGNVVTVDRTEVGGVLGYTNLVTLGYKKERHFVNKVEFPLSYGGSEISEVGGELVLYQETGGGLKKVRTISEIIVGYGVEKVTLDFSRAPLFVEDNQFLAVAVRVHTSYFYGVRTFVDNEEFFNSAYIYKNGTTWIDLEDEEEVSVGINWDDQRRLSFYEEYELVEKVKTQDAIESLKDLNAENIEKSKVETIAEISSSLPAKPYVSVFYEAFKTLHGDWVDTDSSWTVDSVNGTITPTLTGYGRYASGTIQESNNFRLARKYEANKRIMSTRVSFKSDSVLEISTLDGDGNLGDGVRTFTVDVAAQTLNYYRYNGSLIKSESLSSAILPDTDYMVCVSVDKLVTEFSIKNFITGETQKLTHASDLGGVQCNEYSFALRSGSPFTIKDFDISIYNKPKVYIVGDSITAYMGSSEAGWAYKLNEALRDTVVISARGGDAAHSIPELIETEAKYIKPEILMWCHGVNGEGVTEERLLEVQSLCDQYDIKFYANRMTCLPSDRQIQVTDLMESLNIKGARFDVATARDGIPYVVDGDTDSRVDLTLYSDAGVHPNAEGQIKMWERFPIDCPELLK